MTRRKTIAGADDNTEQENFSEGLGETHPAQTQDGLWEV